MSNQSSTPGLSEVLGLDMNNRNINNEIEILKSRTIAQRVADRLDNLGAVPETGEPVSILRKPDGTPGVGPVLTTTLLAILPELGTLTGNRSRRWWERRWGRSRRG